MGTHAMAAELGGEGRKGRNAGDSKGKVCSFTRDGKKRQLTERIGQGTRKRIRKRAVATSNRLKIDQRNSTKKIGRKIRDRRRVLRSFRRMVLQILGHREEGFTEKAGRGDSS